MTETIRHRTGKEPMQTTEGWKQRTLGGRLSRFILAGFIFLFPAGCGKTQQQAAPAPPAVEVAGVIQKDVPVYAEWIASTDGLVNATIRAQVQGYLVARSYKEGDFVRKGQILFEIDPRPFEAAVEQAGGAWHQAQAAHSRAKAALEQVRAEVAQAEARYTPAKSHLDRVRPLAAQHALSQKDLDDAIGSEKTADAAVRAAQAAVAAAQASLEASQAAVLASKAALERARLDLGFTKILSPIDGIAGIAKAQIGNLVGPGSIEELTTVSTVNPIRVYIPVSEQEYMQNNGNGRNTSRQATFELILADGRIHPHKGSFSFTDRQVDTRTGTIKIAAIFPNPGNLLRPGQFARVRAASRVKKGALLVPQRAVIEIQGTYQVAVVGADNKVDIRPVKVAERIGTLWVIDEGLKPGEQVVAEGVQKVRQGMVVTPKPFAPTTGPAPNTPSPPVPASAAKSLSAGQETERR